jgi:hypothetical protein
MREMTRNDPGMMWTTSKGEDLLTEDFFGVSGALLETRMSRPEGKTG